MIARGLLARLACVAGGCGGALVADRRRGLLCCRRCPALYPVLGGVPILVPAPAEYLAGYRDAVLASLAEAGAATGPTVALVDAFASAVGPREPLAFGDDWTAHERAPRPAAATDDAAIAAWLAAAPDPAVAIAAAVPAHARVVVECGCGGNLLAARLAAPRRQVIVTDLSLRAVLRTTAATDAAGVVADAEALPLAAGAVDAIVAANLIDLLEAPADFVATAAAALAPSGALVLSTPDPGLGADDPDALTALLADAGLATELRARGLPWLRTHSPRHYQLYFSDLVVAFSGRDRSRGRARGRDRGRDRGRARDRGRGRSPGRARGRARRPSCAPRPCRAS